MTIIDNRNTGAGSSGTTLTNTNLNALGCSFQTMTLPSGTAYVANPYTGGESTWIQAPFGSSSTTQRLAVNLSTAQETTGSASMGVSFPTLPAVTMPLMDMQVKNSDGTQRSVFTVLIKTSGMVQVGYTNDAKSAKFADTGVTLAAGTNYRINMWADIVGQTCSVAVYNMATGAQVGSTWTVTSADLGASTTLMTAMFWGKLSGAVINATVNMSDFIFTIGKAADAGATPDFTARIAPKMSFFPHVTWYPGEETIHPCQILYRVTPKTSGATENGIVGVSVSAPVTVSGGTVPASQVVDKTGAPAVLQIGSATTSTETSRTRQATLIPYCSQTLIWTVTVTGADSNGTTATATSKVVVPAHDLWSKTSAGLVAPVIPKFS